MTLGGRDRTVVVGTSEPIFVGEVEPLLGFIVIDG